MPRRLPPLQPDALNARLAGTWTADRETLGPSAAGRFRPAQMRFALDRDLLTISHVRVDGLGREEHGSHSIAADGREHLPRVLQLGPRRSSAAQSKDTPRRGSMCTRPRARTRRSACG